MRVELNKVARRFGAFHALREVDLEIPSGARVALIGPNGSGKTTLVRILAGLLGWEGSVRIAGLDARRDRAALAPQMAYIPQVPPGFRVPVEELVTGICRLRGITEEQVWEIADHLALDRAAVIGKGFRDLSGGMKQKLAIATALAPGAGLVLMDEPTASLDADARDRFFSLCRRLPEETTMVLCSHRLEELRSLVDHIVVLEDGRVSFQGTAREFLDARTRSVVELVCDSEDRADWLHSAGFVRGRGGRWRATVDHVAKRELVLRITGELGQDLADLQIRELERLELPGDEE